MRIRENLIVGHDHWDRKHDIQVKNGVNFCLLTDLIQIFP